MSWQIREDALASVIVLEGELCVQNASEFYRAVLPLASSGKAVRMDAVAAKNVHTSILQILYALSQAVEDFGVVARSGEFRLAEARVGFAFPEPKDGGPQIDVDGNKKGNYV